MVLLIKNGLLVTMDAQRRILRGEVVVDGDRIVEVGKGDAGGAYKPEKVIDARGSIVMPGLICAHTHLYGMLLRGASLNIVPPTDFSQILQRVWWPMDEAMTREDAYASALVGCLEFLKTGTTCFADTYSGPNSVDLSLDHIAKAVKEVGIRGILAYEVTERHSSEEGERGVAENVRFIEKIARGGMDKVKGMFSLHASFTLSDQLMEKVRRLADKYRVPLTIHTSEGLGDLYHNMERYGKRTVERLHDLGLLKPDVVLAHCVQLNEDEIGILKKTGAKVAHNPMSNMLNAVGVAPVKAMLREGITVGLGNDGYIFDGFENIRAAFLLHKVHHRDPRVMDPQTVLEMATVKGAEMYGLDQELGSLEAGKKADIIVVKPDVLPTPLTPESVLGHLVNTVDGDDVQTVIVDGEILMENRRVLTVEEEKVNAVSQKAAEELWRRLSAIKPHVEYPKPAASGGE
ncbi:amidohydrolase family protein [Candidatus Hecatella orcuttiae]|uniref:amidohydrolase family protein n=1 Tax=Candidatus Hecatella orcuttiae TaxID=1935119 RepID=UPI002867DEB0|nr:amidohydrolase family protein [Candidatus Hecatella orcuttiae]